MIVVIAFAVLGAGLLIRFLFVTSPNDAAVKRAPRISDTAFERSAVTVCQRYVHTFNTETTLGQQPSSKQAGDFLDSIATSFDRMVGELRVLPVAPPDQAKVSAWIAQWDSYDAYGHEYAAAVRAGKERDLVANDKTRIDGLLRDRNAFAKANHMSACAFS